MRNDFCAFILTHGRPNRVITYDTIINAGYAGAIYIIIDDEDDTADEYFKVFGNKVIVISKPDIAKQFDEGDNFGDRRTIVYARNACFDIARKLGYKYFIQLDDDYSGLYYRFNSDGVYGVYRINSSIESLFELIIAFLDRTPARSIAISQGGDHIGGGEGSVRRLKRKAMNTFVCSTARPFYFVGRVNEDVNTYTSRSRAGDLFFTIMQAQVNQLETQSNKGGMTDIYKLSGTYVKTFYSIMYAPSCIKVGVLKDNRSPHPRIHHTINWNNTAVKIVSETTKKLSDA